MNNEITHLKDNNGNSIGWFSKDTLDAYQKFEKNRESRAWHTNFGNCPRYIKKRKVRDELALPESRWKLAKIKICNTDTIAHIDPLSNKAYKVGEHYSKTWIEIKKYKFTRWMTSFDT